jgi:hypothetical protein
VTHLTNEWFDPVGYNKALVAIATYPNTDEAKAYIEDQGYSKVSVAALETIKRNKGDEIEKVRRELAPKLEGTLVSDLGDEARRATAIIELALQRTEERLRTNVVSDPSRVARDISQLRTQAIDKKLALEGRPTSITETRSHEEVLRSLEAMGVVKQVEVKQVTEG